MKKLIAILGFGMLAVGVGAQPYVPPTTTFTRGFLVVTNQATAQTYLGIGGTNASSGTGITNLPVLSLSRDFAVTGSGDETVKVQNALNSAKPVLVDVTVSITNVFPTNFSYLIGDGKHIILYATNGAGDCFSNSPTVTNVTMDGLIMDGQLGGFASIGNTRPWRQNADSSITQVITGTPRNGFHSGSSQTNSIYRNCKVFNMSGVGFMLDGFGLGFPQPVKSTTKMINCSAELCWIGYQFTNSGEYVCLDDCYGVDSGRGLDISAGNISVIGGEYTRNGIGAYVDGNVTNPAHGVIAGASFNHCNWALYFTGGFTNGMTVSHCMMLGGGSIYLQCGGAVLEGNYISSTLVTNNGFGGMTPNYLIGNMANITYPSITSISNGVIITDGWLNAGAAAIRTNEFTNVFTKLFTATNLNNNLAASNIVSTNVTIVGSTNTGAGPFGMPVICSIWDYLDTGATSPMFTVGGTDIVLGHTSGTGGSHTKIRAIDRTGTTYLTLDPANSRASIIYSLGIGKIIPNGGTPAALDVVGTIVGNLVSSTNGYVSSATNQFAFAATGWTNTTGSNCVVAAGSTAVAATLSDGTNTIRTTAVLTGELPAWILKPNWKVTASGGLAGVAYPQ